MCPGDGGSGVCSSGGGGGGGVAPLMRPVFQLPRCQIAGSRARGQWLARQKAAAYSQPPHGKLSAAATTEIGRASWWEREKIRVFAVSSKKKIYVNCWHI